MGIAAALGDSWVEPGESLHIYLVEHGELRRCWEECYEYFDQNRKYWEHYYEMKDLYIEIFEGTMQLWLVGGAENHWGCFLTAIRRYPKAKVFQILFCAADTTDGIDKLQAGEAFHEHMVTWAKRQGATFSEISFGRLGWKAVGEKLGYECLRVSMRKPLDHVWRH